MDLGDGTVTERDGHFEKVDVYEFVDEHVFETITKQSRPAKMRNFQLGECVRKWDLPYLTSKLGDETVVIHESDQAELDFISKNFRYTSCSFSEFSKRLTDRHAPNRNIYLRCTSKDARKKAARIEEDFPCLAPDLKPPSCIPFGHDNELYHSSVLRIASPNVQIWTHFDLYDNILCQIAGTKRIILLAPEDTGNLYVTGDKSPVNNFDNWQELVAQYPKVIETKPQMCLLEPGDVIFIPSMWWHNIRTIELDQAEQVCSIGFNIFWRDPLIYSQSFYPKQDCYGNKNLTPVEAAISNLDRAASQVNKLPAKYLAFYKQALIKHLNSKLA